MKINPFERFLRQADIIPHAVHDMKFTIIGCGAIGKQVATMAAAMGPSEINLFDFDTVEDHNRTTQGYKLTDVGQPKVEALKKHIEELYDDVKINIYNKKFPSREAAPKNADVIFFCTDNITARKKAWESIRNRDFKFLVDGRMLAETIRIICGTKEEMGQKYDDTLFAPEDAIEGRCTERMTLYSASVCAGNMLGKLNRFLRNERYIPDSLILMRDEIYGPCNNG